MVDFNRNLTIKRAFIKAKKLGSITQAERDQLAAMISTIESTGAKEDLTQQLNNIPIVG